MDDPVRVGDLEGARRLGGDPGGLARRERPGPADDRGEVLALDELHDDERAGRVLAVVVDRDDVRVVQRGRVLGLLAEARAEVGVAAVLGAEQLDGDVAIELVVVAAVDRRHAALAEQLDEPIAATENRPDLRHAGPPCLPPRVGRLTVGGDAPRRHRTVRAGGFADAATRRRARSAAAGQPAPDAARGTRAS